MQTRIVLAQIIHDIESAMPMNDKARPFWHRCLPKRLKPWCKDDRELNPGAVLWVVKGTGADDDDGGHDDAEWGGRLAEMRKTMDAQFKVIRQEADDRAVTADARATKADERAATADARAVKAEAAMDAIRVLLEGGGGGTRGGGTDAVEEKAGEGGGSDTIVESG